MIPNVFYAFLGMKLSQIHNLVLILIGKHNVEWNFQWYREMRSRCRTSKFPRFGWKIVGGEPQWLPDYLLKTP